MADLDEMSLAIGELKGEFRSFREAQLRHYDDVKKYQGEISKKIENIEKYISYNKGKAAMLAAAVSLVITIVVAIIKDFFKRS